MSSQRHIYVATSCVLEWGVLKDGDTGLPINFANNDCEVVGFLPVFLSLDDLEARYGLGAPYERMSIDSREYERLQKEFPKARPEVAS